MSARYATQTRLPEVGSQGQEAFSKAQVLVVGVGGLGCALLPWLAGAGIGRLTIVDPDRIEESNLPRQTLYRSCDIGEFKAFAARDRVAALNPDVTVEAINRAARGDTAENWVKNATIVVDAADNFATTCLLSDLCQTLNRPLVSGSATGWGGYAGVFCGGAPSYRALFPELSGSAPNCAQSGVLGPVVGMIGALQAQLVLSLCLYEIAPEKIPSKIPSPKGVLHRWDALNGRLSRIDFRNALEPAQAWAFLALSRLRPNDLVIDVRQPGELPVLKARHLRGASYLSCPFRNETKERETKEKGQSEKEVFLSKLGTLALGALGSCSRIVIVCRSGARALRAASFLAEAGYENLALLALSLEEVESEKLEEKKEESDA